MSPTTTTSYRGSKRVLQVSGRLGAPPLIRGLLQESAWIRGRVRCRFAETSARPRLTSGESRRCCLGILPFPQWRDMSRKVGVAERGVSPNSNLTARCQSWSSRGLQSMPLVRPSEILVRNILVTRYDRCERTIAYHRMTGSGETAAAAPKGRQKLSGKRTGSRRNLGKACAQATEEAIRATGESFRSKTRAQGRVWRRVSLVFFHAPQDPRRHV